MGFNAGDILFQLFALIVPISFILLIVLMIRKTRSSASSLKAIDQKLDRILQEIEKR